MIQIDIPMPENCAKCPCDGLNEVECSRCNITGHEFNHNIFDGRAEDCPLKELEAMPMIEVEDDDLYAWSPEDVSYYCPRQECGKEISYDYNFCPYCGQAVKLDDSDNDN